MKIIHDYSEADFAEVVEVVSADYVDNYRIKVAFNDGTEKMVDFKPFLSKSLHPSISKYLDERFFVQFKINEGNLNWNDYDLIFPVHDLHSGSI